MTAPALDLGQLPEVDGSNQVRLAERLALLDARAGELAAQGADVRVAECRDGYFRIVPRQRARETR